jgi:hypothetical protein
MWQRTKDNMYHVMLSILELEFSDKGKVVPVLNELSTLPWAHRGEWMYRPAFS